MKTLDSMVSTNIGVPIIINDGTGYLYLDQILPASNTTIVTAGDLHGNTFKDIITYNPNGHTKIWINDGYSNFTVSSQDIVVSSVHSIQVEDRNQDSCKDLVFTKNDETEVVYYNDCYGYFTIAPTPTPTLTPIPVNTSTPTPTPTGQ
jgi:hypothetical protein